MVTQLPVAVRFELPDGWRPAPPDEVGAPGAAFVALNSATQGSGFTANIAVDGEVREDGLAGVAEESVRVLGESAQDIAVVSRQEVGSVRAPGLTQDLRVTANIGGIAHELLQCQVYLVLGTSADQSRGAVVRAALTCTGDQVGAVLDDFRSFVRTLAPDTPADLAADERPRPRHTRSGTPEDRLLHQLDKEIEGD
ncbi:hypothetical protein [Amycolatopsis nigrescens]|uniref:hypothetical protein n=1 Tax=Amycolatopsis nigrescens TaxID=381445 RepID=UPI00035DE7D7|nr:hypothetical protein [Amycolatopsis nigrescens]